MPPQYDPNVDSWWGVILTELGLLDPFREDVSAKIPIFGILKLIGRFRTVPIFSQNSSAFSFLLYPCGR